MGLTFYFFQFEKDKMMQALAAKNLVQGKGVSLQQVHGADLSQEKYEYLVKWPPGYSLLTALPLFFTGEPAVSSLIVDLLFVLLFFIAARRLMNALRINYMLQSALFLFYALSFSRHLIYSTPTDLASVSLCLLVFSEFIRIRHHPNPSVFYYVLLGVLNLLPAIMRYSYLPSTLVIPALFLLAVYRQGEKKIKTGVLTFLMVTIGGLGAFMVYQYYQSGQLTYVIPVEKGLFWNNLPEFYPFIPDSLIDLNFIAVQLSRITRIQYTRWIELAKGANLLLVLFIITALIFFRKKIFNNPKNPFLILSLLFSGVQIAVLLYLSVTNSAYLPYEETHYWTYAGDPRYFALPMVLLPMLLAWFFEVKMYRQTKTALSVKIACYCFYFFMLAGISHGAYYLLKHFRGEKEAKGYQEKLAPLKTFIHHEIQLKKAAGIKTVISSNYTTLTGEAMLSGALCLFNYYELNEVPLQTTEPVELLFIIKPEIAYKFPHFFGRYKPVEIKNISGYSVYSCTLQPIAP